MAKPMDNCKICTAIRILQNPDLILFKVDSTRFEISGRSSKNMINPVKTNNLPALIATFEVPIKKRLTKDTDVKAITQKAEVAITTAP